MTVSILASRRMSKFVVVAALLLSLGCNQRARTVYKEILPGFEKEYPGSTVISAVPDAHPSLPGILGYEVDLTITFKKAGSATLERVVWHCFDHKDQGWIVKGKKTLP